MQSSKSSSQMVILPSPDESAYRNVALSRICQIPIFRESGGIRGAKFQRGEVLRHDPKIKQAPEDRVPAVSRFFGGRSALFWPVESCSKARRSVTTSVRG
jgi:hypothetical protein